MRTEQALAVLMRKIEFTRRLDTARGRKTTLLNHDVPPTRLDLIDRQLDAACEVLLREKLAEQDWVFAQQRLEAADKLLAEPTTEEKDAFHAFLVQRWKSVRDFFGLDGRKIKVPDSLKGLEDAFPAETALPEVDTDGSDWILAIGPMRADLQLDRARDLAISSSSPLRSGRGQGPPEAHADHPFALGTACGPAADSRDLRRGTVDDVLKALHNGEASIEMTPQSVRAYEKVNLALAFKKSKLDTAAARLAIRCEWTIAPVVPQQDTTSRVVQWLTRRKRVPPTPYMAYGWEIYNCFPDTATEWAVKARFYRGGVPVPTTAGGPKTDILIYQKDIRLQDTQAGLGQPG